MEAPSAKRQMNHASQPQQQNPDIASLATLGMRIRKAVADGYALSDSAHLSYDPQFFTRPAEIQNKMSFERVSLPNGMDAPPALCNVGSTFQSGLNVSEWGNNPSMNMSTLPYSSGTKRRFDDNADMFGKFNMQPPAVVNFPSYEEFRAGNGQLSFNEEF